MTFWQRFSTVNVVILRKKKISLSDFIEDRVSILQLNHRPFVDQAFRIRPLTEGFLVRLLDIISKLTGKSVYT